MAESNRQHDICLAGGRRERIALHMGPQYPVVSAQFRNSDRDLRARDSFGESFLRLVGVASDEFLSSVDDHLGRVHAVEPKPPPVGILTLTSLVRRKRIGPANVVPIVDVFA